MAFDTARLLGDENSLSFYNSIEYSKRPSST
jgi:hypothetical protein